MRRALTDLRGYTILDSVGHWPQFEAAERVNTALLGGSVSARASKYSMQ